MTADRPVPKKQPKSLRRRAQLIDLIRAQQPSARLTADAARLLCELEKDIAEIETEITKVRKLRLAPVLNLPPQ
ncbi:MAG TPA: hypothetical protein VMU05_14860 [Dongiaceae bacterium]|nr:hypothetical protein [Dongiaceae bacterium]